MKIKSNTLVKVLVPSVLFVAIFIGLKSCGSAKPGSSASGESNVVADLTPDELRALGIEGDTPEDTLRTIATRMKKLTDQQAALVKRNTQLVEENAALQDKTQKVDQQIRAAVAGVKNEAQSAQGALKSQLDAVTSRLESLGSQMASGNDKPAQSGDIPVGLGLDDVGGGTSGKDGMIWVDPKDGQAFDRNGKPLSAGEKLAGGTFKYPTSFLDDNEITRQKAALEQTAKGYTNEKGGVANEEPVYTVPENATLVSSQAMTALLGRIPLEGKVQDPYPFKIMIGADNLAANGIELPDVEGAIVSGTATGDWTLSCVRGDVYSITFVFTDGTVRTYPKPQRNSNGQGGNGSQKKSENSSIGWISDDQGIPCIQGIRKSNASTYLPTLFGLSTATAAASAFAQSQTTTQNNGPYGQSSTTLTGDAGKYALGAGMAGGMKETTDWVRQRYGMTFDAVYVPPGKNVAVHITREIPIDYEIKGRKVRYDVDTTRLQDLD